ncbi:hypothetical protein [Streptomyces sp. NBC_01481]|uniref:hypothetical protein n=1 Tax=Streptomyces sp. NBC_01481 TaxID=2975869 RepID=UPI002258B542|nr:hypothetical protein [Streptomyces sp. NBC_01481]MCX4581660.1 hypothetical protein [Streptomyces sp. NBC_01481]
MHGHGYVPTQPPRDIPASVIVLRVLFAILPLFSCGMLSWGTMLRLALVTKRPRDWVLFGVVLASFVVCFGAVLSDPTEDLRMLRSDIAIGTMLAVALVVVGWFLYADTRHDAIRRMPPSQSPYYGTTVPYGPPAVAQQIPQAPHTPTPGYGFPPAQPVPPQPLPHQTPASQTSSDKPRIDQVRAELDELSDYLRKDRKEPGP